MAKLFFMTYGCPTNFAETEEMKGRLAKCGFEMLDSPEEAFAVILNICTVKGNTVPLKAIKSTMEMHPYKKIIVAGCITRDIAAEIRKISEEISMISTRNIHRIVEVVEEAINDNPVSALAPPKEERVKLGSAGYSNPIRIIPICSGCTGKCAYCSVRIVKGALFSYPEEEIIREARKSIQHGAKEIWITAQDTASYMLDKQDVTALPELVEKIALIPGEFMIRVGMMNANNLIPAIEKIAQALNSKKVFKFIHLPVQSGADSVLKRMGRKYTSAQFKNAVKYLREKVPGLTVSTDIIAGLPGESKEDFQQTLAFLDEVKPEVVNRSRFRPRPGTDAASMEGQVSADEARQRSKHLMSVYEWTLGRQNREWVGWQGEIIIEEKGSEGTGTFIGRNISYKPIVVEGDFKIGERKKVRITGYTTYHLKGELI